MYGKYTRLSGLKPVKKVSNVMYTIHFYDDWKFVHQGLFGVPFNQKYPTAKDNSKTFVKKLAPLYRFSKKNKVKIYIGEFTVARWAAQGSGSKYLSDAINAFEKYKFDWTYHSFRGASVWDLERVEKRDDTSLSTKPTTRFKVVSKFLGKNFPNHLH